MLCDAKPPWAFTPVLLHVYVSDAAAVVIFLGFIPAWSGIVYAGGFVVPLVISIAAPMRTRDQDRSELISIIGYLHRQLRAIQLMRVTILVVVAGLSLVTVRWTFKGAPDD